MPVPGLPRHPRLPGLRGVARLALEVIALAGALVAAYLVRFDLAVPPDHVRQLAVALPVVVAVQLAVLHAVGVGRQSWQYTTVHDLIRVSLALAGVSVLLLGVRVLVGEVGGAAALGMVSLPIGVVVADLVIGVVALAGFRMARRLQAESVELHRVRSGPGGSERRVVLIGAGRAGLLMARELRRRPDLGMRPVAFLDDDPAKVGRRVAGIDVVGTVSEVGRVVQARRVDEAVITIAALDRADIGRIVGHCERADVGTKIMPGMYEIVRGDVSVSRIRDVDVADLLGRDPVDLDDVPTRELVAGRTVLVTGAGGSIGSELVRQVAWLGPARLLLVERAEPALWAIHREVSSGTDGPDVVPLLGDVCDCERMAAIFAEFVPDIVIHAAAHKHVPMMEANPGEAVKNNVGGTRVVADLAARTQVLRFVLVSTDKAVNPTSVMGATKRVAERYVQHLARSTGVRAVSVRFGNVLGSTGSVVPIFKQQVAEGGPVTVTHADMQRYFMTIPEASQLVLQAATIGRPGETLVLDMGEPVKIVDLAESVIRLSGLRPHVDIEVEFVGLRPGEKLYEELSLTDEHATRTRHPKIWIGSGGEPDSEQVASRVSLLLAHVDDGCGTGLWQLLRSLVPEGSFGPSAGPEPSVPVAPRPGLVGRGNGRPGVVSDAGSQPSPAASARTADTT